MSLLNTRMQALRAKSNLGKNEYRPSRYGALDFYAEQSRTPNGVLTSDLLEKATRSIGRSLQTPVIDFDSGIKISNNRPLIIPDSENTSRMLTISFATYSWGFTIVPAMYMNNEIKIQEDFETKFKKYLYKFAALLDETAVASLLRSKSAIIKDKLNYDFDGDAIKAPYTARENVLGDINALMGSNDFYDQLHVIGSSGVEALVRQLAEKGLYNEVDKQLQYGDKVFHFSTRVPVEAEDYAAMIVAESGQCGMLHRFERECLLNTVSRTGHEWGTDTLPMINVPVGTYYYEDVGNYGSIAGDATADMTRNLKQHYGFAVDIAFVNAYNSNPEELASPFLLVNIGNGALGVQNMVIANGSENPVFTQPVSDTSTVVPTVTAGTVVNQIAPRIFDFNKNTVVSDGPIYAAGLCVKNGSTYSNHRYATMVGEEFSMRAELPTLGTGDTIVMFATNATGTGYSAAIDATLFDKPTQNGAVVLGQFDFESITETSAKLVNNSVNWRLVNVNEDLAGLQLEVSKDEYFTTVDKTIDLSISEDDIMFDVEITGLTAGGIYYVRVKPDVITSNTLALVTNE